MDEPTDDHAETVDGAQSAERVQQAVEAFVALHTRGDAPDLEEFVNDYEADLRSRILSQCREYLTFDDMVGHQEWTAAAEREPEGRPFGDFYIQEELGRGGMGRVFLAEQLEPHRQVALKVLSSAGHDLERRFRRETEVLASLEHPNIARLYEAGIATVGAVDVPYLAMAYVEGSTLAEHARGQALSPQQKLALIAKIARAVHFAHTRGVIHRDLKPANILVDRHGEPRVLDFGVARVVTEDSATRVTHAGEIIGTVPYMSWEQLLGDTAVADPRSDVYSLGVIAYELLTGSLPYDGLETGTLVSSPS